MNLPYKVLATYRPQRWNARLIGQHLTDITHQLGLRPHVDPAHGPLPLTGKNWVSVALHAEVRRRTFKTTQAEGWHWDSDLDPQGRPDCAIIVWASNNPTQIQWRPERGDASRIWQPKPYELVLFHNLHVLHRRPPNCPKIRWIFRQRVSTPVDAP